MLFFNVVAVLLMHVPPSIEFRRAPIAPSSWRGSRWSVPGFVGAPVASSRGGAWSPPPPLRAASFRPLGGSSSSSHDDGEDEEDEDLTHLTAEYRRLADGGDGVAFAAFLRSEEVQAILADDSTFLQDIAEIWMKYAGSDSAPVGLESFIAINREIDDLFEFVDDDDDDGGGYGEPGDDEDGDVLRGEASMLMQEIQEEDPDGDDDFMGDDELGESSRDTFFHRHASPLSNTCPTTHHSRPQV